MVSTKPNCNAVPNIVPNAACIVDKREFIRAFLIINVIDGPGIIAANKYAIPNSIKLYILTIKPLVNLRSSFIFF